MRFFDQDAFINKHILKRDKSMFLQDISDNAKALKMSIQGKSILVIGGAGTIGSSYIKAILEFNPGALTVVDYNENGLTELTRDLRSSYNHLIPKNYITYPFDFGGPIFRKLFLQSDFDVVACFAAHKHVRSEKDHLAIEAMLQNNVFNTKNLLELCNEKKPEHFFCVSTDKAANPVNVMGASKKLMEKVLMAYANDFKISTARFANVAFSNGSLLYGFNHRIQKNQPISSPSDVKRYFVSPIESGQLCMLACFLGQSGEIFFPKLEEKDMLTFSEIAEQYLFELGLLADHSTSEEEARVKANIYNRKDNSYPVYFFKTDTSGEKPFEEFYTNKDQIDLQSFTALGRITSKRSDDKESIMKMLHAIEELFGDEHIKKANIVSLLSKYLEDFSHIETGKSLDNKM